MKEKTAVIPAGTGNEIPGLQSNGVKSLFKCIFNSFFCCRVTDIILIDTRPLALGTIFVTIKAIQPIIMEKIQALERLHQRMIEEIQDYSIILLDYDGTILTWNKGVEQIQGYKHDEIVGQNFSIFYLPGDRQERLPEKLLELAKKEGKARHIGRRVKKDGSIFWGSVLITALHDTENNVLGFTKLTRELREQDWISSRRIF
jgi:PAS domain S-box-containing protein